jgi:diguanylate cyclase (GGDEF)-like protein
LPTRPERSRARTAVGSDIAAAGRWGTIAPSTRLRAGLALIGATIAVAATVAIGDRADVAASTGRWLSQTDRFAANAALAVALVAPLALAGLALLHHRASVSARRELLRLSRHDPLTGLRNRSTLDKAIQRAVRTTRDGVHLAAVLFLDLDRFKQVNDSYGHAVGDELMVAVGRRIVGALGPDQVAVRHGGDEFVVVAGSLRSPVDAETLAGRLVHTLETPFELGPDTVRISVSIGVAMSDRCGAGADDLLADADLAMYAAKASGPGSVRVFEPAMRARLSRANAATRLRAAIDGNELSLRYVPVLKLDDGALVAVRAGQRWDGPGGNPVAGRQLADALEHTGLVVEAGGRALRDACEQLARWKAEPLAVAPQICVPTSPRQLAQAGFRDFVASLLGRLGTNPSQLCLVVGDHALAHEITDAWTMLRHVRTLGVQVALEGFGAGTSSLADIREARIDQLWIHPHLVAGLQPASEDEAIVGHVIALAHDLGMTVVAEGVDTATQHSLLRRLDCDRATGPFFGVDLAADDVTALLPPAPAPVPLERRVDGLSRLPRLRAVR